MIIAFNEWEERRSGSIMLLVALISLFFCLFSVVYLVSFPYFPSSPAIWRCLLPLHHGLSFMVEYLLLFSIYITVCRCFCRLSELLTSHFSPTLFFSFFFFRSYVSSFLMCFFLLIFFVCLILLCSCTPGTIKHFTCDLYVG